MRITDTAVYRPVPPPERPQATTVTAEERLHLLGRQEIRPVRLPEGRPVTYGNRAQMMEQPGTAGYSLRA